MTTSKPLRHSLAWLLCGALASAPLCLRADEGMWLPILLQATIGDMQANGCRLTAEDIYSVNKSSLKDAIVLFGGGCTGDVVSGSGLMFTNHHCGFDVIQNHSSVQNDLISNGFWALNQEEELPNPGLTATFLVRMEDVTAQILKGIPDNISEAARNAWIADNGRRISQKAVAGTHYNAVVRPFYYGNEFYLLVTETFRDVRLVGAPPQGIGNFGGDTDNWVWPRHNADFSVFRIYTDAEGRPADFSPNNLPLRPRRHLRISLAGIHEHDFTMVYGFPGRTQEYLSAAAIRHIETIEDPTRVALRTLRLDILREAMGENDTLRIQYADRYAGIANGWKKWQGEMRGLRLSKAVSRRQAREGDFRRNLQAADSAAYARFGALPDTFEAVYQRFGPLAKRSLYYNEALAALQLPAFAGGFERYVEALKRGDKAAADAESARLREGIPGFFAAFHPLVERRTAVALLQAVADAFPPAERPGIFQEADAKMGGISAYYLSGMAKSVFADEKRLLDALDKPVAKRFEEDPMFRVFLSFRAFYRSYEADLADFTAKNDSLMRRYMAAQRTAFKTKKFYPDANSTLRVAYGKVEGYSPHDGSSYHWFTTLDGVIEKHNPEVAEFRVPRRLIELHQDDDYGRYGDKATGKLRVAFIASNHTTGGNSGSPVLNAEGDLVGINFDRCWEGTMSDINYDRRLCRNISVDIRYVLFIIDKFAGAGYLLQEMTLVP